jgi:hypothetical protein
VRLQTLCNAQASSTKPQGIYICVTSEASSMENLNGQQQQQQQKLQTVGNDENGG